MVLGSRWRANGCTAILSRQDRKHKQRLAKTWREAERVGSLVRWIVGPSDLGHHFHLQKQMYWENSSQWKLLRDLLPGGWYMAWLKHVKSSFNISVLLVSSRGSWGAVWAKPTPASQIYSQLSIECRSSCLSWTKWHMINRKIMGQLKHLQALSFCWQRQWNQGRRADHTGHLKETGPVG